MKLKIFSLLTIIAVLFTLTGCSGQKNKSSDSLYDLIIEDSSSASTDNTSADPITAEDSSSEISSEPQSDIPADSEDPEDDEYTEYWFRTKKLRDQHYEKHGIEMGFASADDYRKAASDVVNDPSALHKTEKEDGDDAYYLEETNEFVIVSKDGYLRTYFKPDKGKAYFDRQ
ncbi:MULTISPECIES: hypothetical protein [Ruminococcus]|uniref:Lipoprotein n=1 Tax=Ruminococcus albus (strain ATCC 27210 / DSM 20455 / JCM 14654 / NCDO 2250 / 7) TaxID=697329 RepID=E6UCZ8_RUMA7|nr:MULTISPECIES: hypothetical protein [Ruminococcus]ADU20792.1 hypothetical protein Rumal_0235 [Ruminococcus albus 7 = DSM 20455]MCR5020172.1 hypothetical protein [Ruminococcus sp.]